MFFIRKIFFTIFLLIFSVLLFATERVAKIKGKFLQTQMPSVNLLYYDIIKESFTYISTSKVSPTGDFEMAFSLREPIFCKFYEDFFYISPGDSISIYITDDSLSPKQYSLEIIGENASHYEFSSHLKLNSNFDIDKAIRNYKGDWQEFKKNCFNKYKNDINFLDSYASNRKVSKTFYKFFSDNIFCDYLVNVLQPFYTNKKYNSLLIKEYFKSIQIDSLFESQDLFHHQSFRQFCSDYLKFLISKDLPDTNIYTQASLLYSFINANYSGKIREHFLVYLYNTSYKIKSPETQEVIVNVFNSSLEFKDEFIKTHIKSKYTLFLNINNTLPDSVTAIKLSDIKGNTFTLKKIIESLRGSYILIDNWATWCTPCIQEINKGKGIKKAGFLKRDNVEILYISQDRNSIAWQQFTRKNSRYLKRSYLLLDISNSFMQYFNITSIPRYILLNKEGELIDIAAPRISEYSDLLKLLR